MIALRKKMLMHSDQGAQYRFMCVLVLDVNQQRKTPQQYIADSGIAIERRRNIFLTLDRRTENELQAMLKEENYYAHYTIQ